jgi:hypothetical protein
MNNMKKLLLLTTLLFWGLLLTWCNVNPNNQESESTTMLWAKSSQFDLESELWRIEACADRVGFHLNTNDYDISWEDENEGWASFIRDGHVSYVKQWEEAEDDVQCIIDMVDNSVNIEFSNHIYNWELQ